MSIDFQCDTPDCMFWSEEDDCTKKTAIMIQEHCCCDFEERKPVYQYCLIAGLPRLLSEVFVTVSGGIYYKARFLGYGAYGDNSLHKTYCVEVLRDDGYKFVDFFSDIYSRRLEEA